MTLEIVLKFISDNKDIVKTALISIILVPAVNHTITYLKDKAKKKKKADIFYLNRLNDFDWKLKLGWPKQTYDQGSVQNLFTALGALNLTFKDKNLNRDYKKLMEELSYLAFNHPNSKRSRSEIDPVTNNTKVIMLDIKEFQEQTAQWTNKLEDFKTKGRLFIKVND